MKSLDKKLIDAADFNSAVGMGSIINRAYIANVDEVMSFDIPDGEKKSAIDTLYQMSTFELELYTSLYPSISVVGPARYNVKKGTAAAEKRAAAGDATRAFMSKLRAEQQAKIRKSNQDALVQAFLAAVETKQKEFSHAGIDYVIRGRTRFIEKKYATI